MQVAVGLFLVFYRDGVQTKFPRSFGVFRVIIEENGVLYPIEIKKNASVTADMTSAFQILDTIPEKKRGMGAVICMCPQPGTLRENVLQIPVWYI